MGNQFKLIVINDAAVARGGATMLAIESAIGAAQAGWDVTFFSQNHNTPDPRLAGAGVILKGADGPRITNQPQRKAILSGIWNGAAKRALGDVLAEHDLSRTIIHVHNWSHFLSPSIFEPLRPVQNRVVMSTHDFFLTCGNGGQFNFQSRSPCRLIGNSAECLRTRCDKRNTIHKMWRVARHKFRAQTFPADTFCGKIALVHEKQKPFFERAGFNPKYMTEIRNPVSPLTDGRVKAERNKSILFIGRLDIEKGADIAAKAADLAGAKIVFAGEGPLKETIQQNFANAKIVGFCDRQKLADLIRKARLVIVPSWLESFGLAAVEALWSGVPVLMSQNALLSEDIVIRDAGVRIDPSDIQTTSEIIKSMMLDDVRIKCLSENAFHNCADIANTHESWTRAHLDNYNIMLSSLSVNANCSPIATTDHRKVALLNVHYSANLGDGLLSDCLAYGLEHDVQEIECIPIDLAGRDSIATLGGSKRGAALKILAQLPAPVRRALIALLQKYFLKTLWIPHYESKLARADCIVLGGGNLVVDQDLNFPVKINGALNVARNKNLPVHIYGVGVGSEFSEKALSLFRDAFSQCDLKSVAVRDEVSRKNWDKFFAAHCGRSAQIVFDPGVIAAQRWPHLTCPRGMTTPIDCAIGIMSPNELNYHNAGTKFVDLGKWYLELIQNLQNQGLHIVLFSNGSPEDTKFIQSYLAPQIEDVDVFIPSDHCELSALLSHSKLTVAFRLHAIIPATSYGKHVVALEWDKKIRSFMTMIGKTDQCFNMRETGAAEIAKKCFKLLKQPAPSSAFTREAERQMRALATKILN